MAIQAVLNRPTTTIKVKVTDTGFTQSNSTQPVTLENENVRFDQMADVVESGATNNSVPVYNSETDKYEVKQLNLDGGTF